MQTSLKQNVGEDWLIISGDEIDKQATKQLNGSMANILPAFKNVLLLLPTGSNPPFKIRLIGNIVCGVCRKEFEFNYVTYRTGSATGRIQCLHCHCIMRNGLWSVSDKFSGELAKFDNSKAHWITLQVEAAPAGDYVSAPITNIENIISNPEED